MVDGCPGVSNKDMKTIYRELELADRNGNGVIEEKSFGSPEEGYNANIDINRDGKLVAAEIKYYYNYYMQAFNRDLVEGPEICLTNDDKSTLLTLFNEKLDIANAEDNLAHKADILKNWACGIHAIGLDEKSLTAIFKKALEIAWDGYAQAENLQGFHWHVFHKDDGNHYIKDDAQPVHEAAAAILTAMAKSGFYEEALKEYRQIHQKWKANEWSTYHKLFVAIAIERAKHGDLDGAKYLAGRHSFKEDRAVSRIIATETAKAEDFEDALDWVWSDNKGISEVLAIMADYNRTADENSKLDSFQLKLLFTTALEHLRSTSRDFLLTIDSIDSYMRDAGLSEEEINEMHKSFPTHYKP